MDDLAENVGRDLYRSPEPNRDGRGRFVSAESESLRFWRSVDISTPAGCWPWTGPTSSSSYPRFRTRAGWVLAHRYLWQLFRRRLADNETLDHLIGRGLPCTTILCVRPDHLEPCTAAENTRRRHERERQMNGAHL